MCQLPIFASGQLGIQGNYLIQDVPSYESPSINNLNLQTMYGYGVSYWFRLKKVRWEFSPTLMQYKSILSETSSEGDPRQTMTGFQVQNSFYLMDFKNDCMCPTFSKQGEWIRKGFFVYATPGLVMNTFSIDDSNIDDRIVGFGEIGVGLDIGLNNYFTISPSLGYRQLFGYEAISNIQTKSSYNQVVSGIKVIVRWDKKNFY